MTVGQLIEKLSTLDPAAPVLVRNKEGWLSVVSAATPTTARQMTHWDDWQTADKTKADDPLYRETTAVVVVQ